MSTSPNVGSVFGGPANIASKTSSAVANVAQSMRTGAANSINSITNSMRSLNSSIATPLLESIANVPSSSPGLGVILPIILGVGALIIALTLVIYYRSNIEDGAYSAYSHMKKLFKGLTGKDTPPPPPPPENPLEFPPQEHGTPHPSTDVVNKILPGRKQVFNVSSNKYTYNDAEPLCKALGAELATYDQVKQAWDEGADWCNYGWVKGQAAVYPTQKTTFDELQGGGNEDERLACGQPGVNGGFFDNPELRFGVNCYGDKPSQTSHDLRVTNENAFPPLTPDALKQKKKELAYKSKIDQIGLLPFRAHTWSN